MKITKLVYQKKTPNRVSVYVDDQFAAGLDLNDLIKLQLYQGQEISQLELNKIIGESEFGKLFNAALNFLSYRPRSEWEIRHKLGFKTKDTKLIESVVSKLKKIGQIDDLNFATRYINQRQTFRPLGRFALNFQLRKKGLTRETIKKVLTATGDSHNLISDEQLATKVARKYLARISSDLTSGTKKKYQQKLQRLLTSRGFDWDTTKIVIDKLIPKRYNHFD